MIAPPLPTRPSGPAAASRCCPTTCVSWGRTGAMTPRPARTVPAHPGESHKAIDVTASRF